MATVVRLRRPSQRELSPYKRYELLTGEIRYPLLDYTGFGDGRSSDVAAYISDRMREDWAANRDELLALWRSGKFTDDLPWLFARGSAGTLPWAARQFDAATRPPGAPRDADHGNAYPRRQT